MSCGMQDSKLIRPTGRVRVYKLQAIEQLKARLKKQANKKKEAKLQRSVLLRRCTSACSSQQQCGSHMAGMASS